MPVRRRKDRSGLKASIRFYVENVGDVRRSGRHYFDVFLWRSRKAMAGGIPPDDYDDGAKAYVCHEDWRLNFSDGRDGEYVDRPRVCEVHFYAGGWDHEVVAHELSHVMFGVLRKSDYGASLGPKTKAVIGQDDDAEEVICYRFGRWYREVYEWLWTVDPSSRWKRVKAGRRG